MFSFIYIFGENALPPKLTDLSAPTPKLIR